MSKILRDQKINIKKSVIINNEISKVYKILVDVEKWNLWTKSINKISFLENNKFEINGKVRVEQPKLPPTVWTITEIITNKSFTWQSRTLGVTLTAKHLLKSSDNATFVEQEIIYEGFLAYLIYKLSFNLTSNYMTMEVDGLKVECEKSFNDQSA